MSFYQLVQLSAAFLLLVLIAIVTYEFINYRRMKVDFTEELLRSHLRSTFRKYIFFLPQPNGAKFKHIQKLITDAGWTISVESFYLVRVAMLTVGFILLVSVKFTNIEVSIQEIVDDVNFKKSGFDTEAIYIKETAENIDKDRAIYDRVDTLFKDNSKLFNVKLRDDNIAEIEQIIINSGIELAESTYAAARKNYFKLLAVRLIENDYTQYAAIFLLILALYFLPIFLAMIKISLIMSKKDWEVLNLINVFSIFGMLPPYDIKVVLENMLIVSNVYKPIITELYEGVKNAKGDELFDSVLEKIDNDDMYKLIESIKISNTTGLLNEAEKLMRKNESRLKKIDIKNIKKREAKLRYALIPLALVMLIGSLYFMLGTNFISNPNNLLNNF